MMADFIPRDGWSLGVKKTFDGDHACFMCRAIVTGRAAEHRQENRLPGKDRTEPDGLKGSFIAAESIAPPQKVPTSTTVALASPWQFPGRLLGAPEPPPPKRIG